MERLVKRVSLIVLSLLMMVSLTSMIVIAIDEDEFDADSDNYLGSIIDDEGLLPDDPYYVPPTTRAASLLYTMTVGTIYDLSTTYNSSGKNFTRGSLTNDFYAMYGTLTHSSSTSTTPIKIGSCFTNDNGAYFITQTSSLIPSGKSGQHTSIYTSFNGSTTYYSFIKNDAGTGYITGGPINVYNGKT